MPTILAEGNSLMGTKAAPGFYSYMGKAEPDEPVFVLLGRDPQAPALVRQWADERQALGERRDRVAEAYALASEMEKYATAFRARPTNTVVLEE